MLCGSRVRFKCLYGQSLHNHTQFLTFRTFFVCITRVEAGSQQPKLFGPYPNINGSLLIRDLV